MKYSVSLTEKQAKDFVSIVSLRSGNYDLSSGSRSADAKSLLGVISLGFSIPLVLSSPEPECDGLLIDDLLSIGVSIRPLESNS